MQIITEESSFRDPSGFIFYKDGKVLRQVNKVYKDNFDLLVKSGLYQKLLKEKLILPYQKIPHNLSQDKNAYLTIETEKIPFISYPYEWSFSQLKDGALLTLNIQKNALEHDMILKDASAYNIQFLKGRPIFIDHLSFEKYEEGRPWIAYRQFCQHFLAPLALMAKKDLRLGELFKIYIDGIPLNMASSLLPRSTWLNFSLMPHIHIHGKSQSHFSESENADKKHKANLSRQSLKAIIDSLESSIKNLKFPEAKTQWGNYYSFTNYSDSAFDHKKKIVKSMIFELNPKTVWDLGANTGEFSKEAAADGANVISFDLDPVAVEKNYIAVCKNKETKILPLLMDLTNPSPGLGWELAERKSLIARGPADCIMALALIHHLAISNNVPLPRIAKFFANITKSALVEFVPKTDSQVKKLLSTREDIFVNYTKDGFEKAFSKYFKITACEKIVASDRIMYCLEKK